MVICVFVCACSQHSESMDKHWKKLEQSMDSSISKNYYMLSLSSNGCNFKIYINDIRVTWYDGTGGRTGSIPINFNILRSGIQKIKVKLYPVKGHEDKGINSKHPLRLAIKYKSDPNLGLDDFITLQEDIIPEIEEGTPYFEYETTFNATVPYRLEGWSKCQDLREKNNIKELVIEKYQEIGNLMVNEKFDKLRELISFKCTEAHFANYLPFDEYNMEIDEWIENFKGFETVDVMDDYELVFFNDGKLVALLNPLTQAEGFLIRGGGYEWGQFVILGMRQGSNELEIIR